MKPPLAPVTVTDRTSASSVAYSIAYIAHPPDLPPKKESSYNVSKLRQKGGINGKEKLHSRANH